MKNRSTAKEAKALHRALAAHRLVASQNPRAHVRCQICRPHGNPRPLPIDGREYRRRARRRTRD